MHYLCKKKLTLADCELLYSEICKLKKIIAMEPDPHSVIMAVEKLRDLAFLTRHALKRSAKTKLWER
jgi:hypothetical protein